MAQHERKQTKKKEDIRNAVQNQDWLPLLHIHAQPSFAAGLPFSSIYTTDMEIILHGVFIRGFYFELWICSSSYRADM